MTISYFLCGKTILELWNRHSWIVFLTIQELSKAQGNNTDINNTEYSNTDLILSGDKEVSISVDTVEQTV